MKKIPYYIIIATLIAEIICFYAMYKDGGFDIMDAIVAVLVAIIGIIGTGIKIIYDAKKQSDKITDKTDGVNGNVLKVKDDTDYMKPKIDNIFENTKNINSFVSLNKNSFNTVFKQLGNINDDVEYRKRLQSELSTNISNKDYFVEGIEKLYAENAALNHENKSLKQQLRDREDFIKLQNNKINELSAELEEISPKMNYNGYDMER